MADGKAITWASWFKVFENAAGGEEPAPLDEAASDPPSPAEITDETTLDELAKDAPRAGIAAQAGQGAEEIAEVVEDSPQPEVGMPSAWSTCCTS